jgi:hypothetical protein
VREAIRSDGPPHYERERKGSIVDAVGPVVLSLLKEFPAMPATVIAERIDWPYSIRVLRDRVAELRPLFVPPDPCQGTFYRPGELAQFDLWQPTCRSRWASTRPTSCGWWSPAWASRASWAPG